MARWWIPNVNIILYIYTLLLYVPTMIINCINQPWHTYHLPPIRYSTETFYFYLRIIIYLFNRIIILLYDYLVLFYTLEPRARNNIIIVYNMDGA